MGAGKGYGGVHSTRHRASKSVFHEDASLKKAQQQSLYATSDKNTTDTAALHGSSTRPGGGAATLAEIFEELDLSEDVGGKRRAQVSR